MTDEAEREALIALLEEAMEGPLKELAAIKGACHKVMLKIPDAINRARGIHVVYKSNLDSTSILKWATSEPRHPAHMAFPEGTERNVALLIERYDGMRVKLSGKSHCSGALMLRRRIKPQLS